MKLTKQIDAEILKLYLRYWDAYFRGDMKTFAFMLDDNCHIIGSTEFDVFNNKKKAVKYYQAAFTKSEIGDLTKDMMIEKVTELKKGNSKK